MSDEDVTVLPATQFDALTSTLDEPDPAPNLARLCEGPRYWVDSRLRLRPIATLPRDGYGIRQLGVKRKRRKEPM